MTAGIQFIEKHTISDSRSSTFFVLSRLCDFADSHPELRGRPRWEVIRAWIGDMAIDPRLATSTLCARVEEAERLRMDPWDRAGNLMRYQASRNLAAVKRARDDAPPINVKPLLPLETYRALLALPRPHNVDPLSHARYRILFWLGVATGARIRHLLNAVHIRLEPSAVVVLWGKRKRAPRCTTEVAYKFEWSIPPPADVRMILDALGGQRLPPSFGDAQVSSYVNKWLEKLGSGLTRKEKADGNSGVSSCCPRVRLINTLIPMVEAGELDRTRYEILLGHRWETGMRYYRRET